MLEDDNIDALVMKLADNQFLYKLDDSLMWLFNIESGEHHDLNESSCFVLSLFDGKRTVGEIRQLYLERYSESGVAKEGLVEDFNRLLEHLIDASVLTWKN